MARRRRAPSGRRSSRDGKTYVWTVVVGNQITIPAGAQQVSSIAIPPDWQRASAARETCTILAIRGWVSLSHKAALASVTANNVMMYIGKVDEDVAVPADPALASTYADEDIMWTGGVQWPFSDSDGLTWGYEFNVKAKRKLTSGEDLNLITRTNTTQVEFSCVVRALLLM